MNIRFFSRIMLCGTLASGIPVMNQALAVTDSAPIQVDSKTIKVTGIVKDNVGPIVGASISEKGTTNSTVTNIDGNFTLNVKSGATLVVSYIGMNSPEHSVETSIRWTTKQPSPQPKTCKYVMS